MIMKYLILSEQRFDAVITYRLYKIASICGTRQWRINDIVTRSSDIQMKRSTSSPDKGLYCIYSPRASGISKFFFRAHHTLSNIRPMPRIIRYRGQNWGLKWYQVKLLSGYDITILDEHS